MSEGLIALRNQIEKHPPFDEVELTMKQQFLDFIEHYDNHFSRKQLFGHFTASAWILSPDKQEAFLIHHKKLNKWLQPGGHADDDENLLNVAIKEIHEETGITQFDTENKIFDLDVHLIPERLAVPAHFHFDVRFLFKTHSKNFQINHEANMGQWILLSAIENYNKETSILRMRDKCLVH